MKSFTAFITEAISSQTVAKPDPNKDEADMTVACLLYTSDAADE